MTVNRFLLESETYQNLDEKQKACIDILRNNRSKPSDIEDNITRYVLYSIDKMQPIDVICSAIDELVTCPTAKSNISEAVAKMVKNGDGITGHIADLKKMPIFVNPMTWQALKKIPCNQP